VWRIPLLILLALALVAGCTSTPDTGAVGPAGGTVTSHDVPGAQLVVPPGSVGGPVHVTISTVADPPRSTFGSEVRQIGPTVDIMPTAPVPNARVRLPFAVSDLGPDPAQFDVFIAVYSDALGVWMPLATDYDPQAHQVSAIAPHFSKHSVFSYPVGALRAARSGIGWAGRQVGDLAHDVAGGVKQFAAGIVNGLAGFFTGNALKPVECDGKAADWTFSSPAKEVDGCVVTEEPAQLRIGNEYRVPFTLAPSSGLTRDLTDSDYELDLVGAMMRFISNGAGLGEVAPRGRTALGIPVEKLTAADRLDVAANPDLLGIALNVILGLLSFIPDEAVFTQVADRAVVVELWNFSKSGASAAQVIVHTQEVVERSVRSPGALRFAKEFADSASCALKKVEALNTGGKDPEAVAEGLVDAAKECAEEVLEAAESSLKEAWDLVKSALDGIQAIREVLDAIKLGLTHLGGQLRLAATHQQAEPVAVLPPDAHPNVAGVDPVNDVGYITAVTGPDDAAVLSFDRVTFHWCTPTELQNAQPPDCLNDYRKSNTNTLLRQYRLTAATKIFVQSGVRSQSPVATDVAGLRQALRQRAGTYVLQLDDKGDALAMGEAWLP
jgi:hypothetical protein